MSSPTATPGRAALAVVELMGTLRLVVMEIALSEGAEVIDRQRQQLLELSTPVIKLWDRVVAVPLIGTLDSARTQVVMETLLEAIVDQHAAMAILDITGVPMVDTVVAQYLMKTAMAVRLMGAECVISGIRPADRADHRAAGHRPRRHHHACDAGRRPGVGAGEGRRHRHGGGVSAEPGA